MSEPLYTLHCGDCLEVLRTLPDNSVDAVVTDPPAGIGFMTGNAGWDGNKGGRDQWINWLSEVMVEVKRVLKPGGHALVWSIARTQHWTATACENAGFEVRDVVSYLHDAGTDWSNFLESLSPEQLQGFEIALASQVDTGFDSVLSIFGCLTPDTEILTENGFIYIDQLQKEKKHRIFTYDINTDSYALETPSKWSVYENTDSVYSIKSDNTDQLVSRNHRCLIERDGALLFEFAENLENAVYVPILEILPSVLSVDIQGNGQLFKEQNVLPRMHNKINGSFQKRQTNRKANTKGRVQLHKLWGKNVKVPIIHKRSGKVVLQSKVLRTMDIDRPYNLTEIERYSVVRTRWLDRGNEKSCFGKAQRRKQSSMERWPLLRKEKRQLLEVFNKVGKMPAGIYFDGSKRRVGCGTQNIGCLKNGQAVATFGVCPPYRPQSRKQRYKQSNVVCNERGTSAIRTRKTYSTTLATVTKVEYKGKVYCPTVSTGAFVARRNGKIFITGNSGFPKGLSISLAVDSLLGKERTVVGEKKKIQSYGLESNNTLGGSPDKNGVMQITAPASDEAAQWEGWKTALKPAVENWILLRKPVEKGLTIAENVLKHGVGGLNVGACAIETTPEQNEKDIARVGYKDGAKHNTKNNPLKDANVYSGFEYESVTPLAYVENGRYPSHLILDSSDAVESIFPDTGASNARPNCDGKVYSNENNNISSWKVSNGRINIVVPDNGGSASRYFYHAKVSPTDRNEGCENLPNRHATVKSNNLCRYLCRLITPPNGVILDCFMGSGSTGKAAMQECFRFIGIEQNPEYVAIAEARILWAIQQTGLTPEKAEALNLSNPTGLTKDVPLKMF